MLAASFVVMLGLWLHLPRLEWALLFSAMSLVFVAELFNTALEALADLTSPETHPLAKIAKDVGASAVLVASMAAALAGLLILGPPLLDRILSARAL